MQPSEIISKKKRGEEHSHEELSFILSSFLKGDFTDFQMSAWLMAVCFQGMTLSEMVEWTRLMWKSGITFPRKHKEEFWIDKHSTGGVGDKPSLLLVPLVSAAAERVLGKGKVKLPMVSGRGLGHTGGTLDKLESVPGFSSKLKIDSALTLLEQNGFFMMGQTDEIAPADRRIYALRDVTSTIDSLPLIVSSIMSKKLSENLDGIVFDVKVGIGAFMKNQTQASELAKALVSVAKENKIEAVALLTRMDEPLGTKVGNFLEVEECWDFLNGKQEKGLKECVTEMAAEMLFLAARGKLARPTCLEVCQEELSRNRSGEMFKLMFQSQGGSWQDFEVARRGLPARYKTLSIKAEQSGYLSSCNALEVGLLLNRIGGGRKKPNDQVDPRVGFTFFKKVGDSVSKGETLVECVVKKEEQEEMIHSRFASIIQIQKDKLDKGSIILEKIL